MMYYGWGPMMGWGGFSLFGAFWMIIFWIIIAYIVISLFRRHDEKKETKEKTAMDILKDRYAKGEINKKEYEEKKKDIEKD